MVAIIDYGVGNLFSLKSSFAEIGIKAQVTSEESVIRSANRIILPGVGAFSDAAKKLRQSGMDEIIISEVKKGKPVMGICLGMQLLFEKSYENGEYDGLGLIEGKVVPIKDALSEDLKIPHIGWNSLDIKMEKCPLFKYIKNGEYVYFVHSYYVKTDNSFIAAVTDYGAPLTAAVAKGNLFGCQFHPEKSGNTGLNILRAFCETEG
ncbi:MAG: imidazole glycerol phosphate synthase subunit HisH [Clostridia bacterium]|nr:imidazole glycerol phosphate synthase subunit HisH [Clostridia bacterium]